MFKLILFDINQSLCDELNRVFVGEESVEVVCAPFSELPQIDCIVSPANSFGMMDGGFDKVLMEYFGKRFVIKGVQEYIIENYAGEQPVGTSFIIETGNEKHPFLAHTPTMRVPLDISNTDNVYRAMKALLLAVENYNKNHPGNLIKTLGCPGLGTGVGDMSYETASTLMHLAYKHYRNKPKKIRWGYAWDRHLEIERAYKPENK